RQGRACAACRQGAGIFLHLAGHARRDMVQGRGIDGQAALPPNTTADRSSLLCDGMVALAVDDGAQDHVGSSEPCAVESHGAYLSKRTLNLVAAPCPRCYVGDGAAQSDRPRRRDDKKIPVKDFLNARSILSLHVATYSMKHFLKKSGMIFLSSTDSRPNL